MRLDSDEITRHINKGTNLGGGNEAMALSDAIVRNVKY